MFNGQQLKVLAELVMAAGKSPLTGLDGMRAASMALMWIEQAASELPASPAPSLENEQAAE